MSRQHNVKVSERMADRILGMGDIVSLVERAQEQYDEKEAQRLQRRIQKNQFDFNVGTVDTVTGMPFNSSWQWYSPCLTNSPVRLSAS